LRHIGRRAGISVHPHLFRHTLAQGVLETTGNIKVAQEILGHSHLSTTADLYLRVDQNEMVRASGELGTRLCRPPFYLVLQNWSPLFSLFHPAMLTPVSDLR
jgi:integrase